ncbi:hypothetical protein [Streptosporangium sandarakinum]|uniref:hypothetical protein n=1 Tax=Streptosporangium sandarakinum TaxID=1260955 RepID=UPI0033BB8321
MGAAAGVPTRRDAGRAVPRGGARHWRPDLVVFEPTSYAGPLVAALLGVPAVRHIHGVDMTYQARDIVPEVLAPTAARLGWTAARCWAT